MLRECPYRGLVPYGEDDAPYFFGRDRERRLLSASLRASRLTVLYGESGVGKSSVLAAGVADDLRDDPEYALVLFRNWPDEPMTGLLNAVRDRLSELPGSIPNGDGRTQDNFNALLQSWSEATKRSLLVVLDQFEEYFQYHPRENTPGTLADALPRLLNQPDLPVNFLVAVREDALGALDRFKGVIPNLFDNLVRVEHLSKQAAQEAIVKPLNKFNKDLRAGRFSASADRLHPVEIEEAVAAQVVQEILWAQGEGQERVQAPYLQLVMTRWWERDIATKSPAMRLETLQDLGGVKTIVERYLEDTLGTLSPGEKEVVAEAFRYMVTPTGRKIAQTTTDLTKNLLSFLSLEGTSLEDILSRLQAARLLRKVPPPRGSSPDEGCYEFAHDVVAKAALEWRRQFRRAQQLAEAKKKEEQANQRAEEQARLAEMERHLSMKANLLAEESAKRAEAERERAEEQARLAELQGQLAEEQRRVAKRFGRLALALGAMLLLALATVVFAFWKTAVARARELVAASRSAEETDPELSVLIAAQGVAATWRWGHTVLPEAEQQLHRAIMASHVRMTLSADEGYVWSVAWSPDGTRLATGSQDKTAKIWDAKTGKELLTLSGHRGPVLSVAWSPHGKRLATGSGDHTAKVWDAETGKELLTMSVAFVSGVAWSPDGKRLATGSEGKTAKVWDAGTGKELVTMRGQSRDVAEVAWSPDGKRLATGGAEGTAKVWDTGSGKELLTLSANSPVYSVGWSPDGKRVATGSGDKILRVWKADTGKEFLTLSGFNNGISSVAWSPDGNRLAAGSGDKTAKVWDAEMGKELLALSGHSDGVSSVAWSPDGKRLATGSLDKTAKVWDAEMGKELLTLGGHTGSVDTVAWSPDGKRLATGGEEGSSAYVWEANTGDKLLTLNGGVCSLAWSQDGKRLATGSLVDTAKVRDAETGKELLALGGKRPFYSVVWSPDAKRLATGSLDKTASVWDAETGKVLLTLSGHSGAVWSVAWSPDGKRLATGSEDKTAKMWDAATGKELVTMRGHDVGKVAWSPDGKRLATGGADGTAKLWDTGTGKLLRTLSGHSDFVTSVAWSPGGKRLATGSNDHTEKVWDAGSGKELLTLRGHNDSVTSLSWSPDGNRLATASADGTVQVYAMEIRDLMELARQRVTAHGSAEGCKRYLHVDKCPPVPELSFW